MPIKVIPKSEQASGQFNGGAILEKKPIGFPQDGGKQRPYSNLFYWAHAWTDNGSLIGEHPHQGFEIMSFVLSGDIEHYDSKNNDWKKLDTGDVQIIRSGNGITHAEKMNAGSSMFQIWFDPDLNKTLGKPATYDDYNSESFPVTETDNMKVKTFKGEGAPIEMDAEGVVIKEICLVQGKYNLELESNTVYSYFIIDGESKVGDHQLQKGDFFMVNETDTLSIEATESSRIFCIESPLKLSYKTYSEMRFAH